MHQTSRLFAGALAFGALLSIALGVPTLAEEAQPRPPLERQVRGLAGKDIRIAVFVNVTERCTPGPLPSIKLAQAPANGTVTVKNAKLRVTNIRDCLGLEAPAFIAVYRARPDFSGTDTVVLEVKDAVGKAVQTQTITIHVSAVGRENI
jgi:hypothetical protein